MNESEEIIRIAARGDGITASGRHVAGGVPGDHLRADGTLTPGPHHIMPPCRHFPRCGGCQLQHADDAALADFVRQRVAFAAEALAPATITPAHLSPPRSRRRATLHAVNDAGMARIGFREGGTHKVVDMHECHVLAPELFALVAPLRAYLSRRGGRFAADIALTLADQGVDVAIKGLEIEGLDAIETLLDLCRDERLARLSLDQGYGAETFWEPEPVTVTLSGVPVPCPPAAFLQATRDGEAALVAAARTWMHGCETTADLFAGLGTFAFAIGGRVTAVEAEQAAHLACRNAAAQHGRAVEAVHRDLFRNPLRAAELARFDAVILDPPRAGARAQVEQLAASGVPRIVYISCNPSSWSRDGAVLTAAGYRLAELRPVGQFRWSTHVELASLFLKNAD